MSAYKETTSIVSANCVLSTVATAGDVCARETAYRWPLQFYAPTVAAQQVLFIGVKQFSA